MAYQVFAKAQAQQRTALNAAAPTATSPPLSPPLLLAKQPPLHPAPLVLPQSATSSSSSIPNKPPSIGDPNFTPQPFSEPLTSYKTPHPHITIDPVRTAHIPSLSRITGLLLPIRYPSSFYTACITDPVIASLSRVAVYHDHPVPSGPSAETTFGGAPPASNSATGAGLGGTEKVIGGIRCRLERLFPEFSGLNGQGSRPPPTNLYIQTLHLLSPHRGNGVAASLLNALLFSKPPSESSKSYRVSPLVRYYNIHTVTAHVHETNDEGLRWYAARGFHVEDGVVKGYYRRLNPGGARIVRLDLAWDDNEQEEKTDPHQQQDSQTSIGSSDILDTRSPVHEQQGDGNDDEDDDWEKLEAEDDDADDHGIVHLTDSQTLDSHSPVSTTSSSGKRKRDVEKFQKSYR